MHGRSTLELLSLLRIGSLSSRWLGSRAGTRPLLQFEQRACRISNRKRHAAAGRGKESGRSGFERRVGPRRGSALPRLTLRRQPGRRSAREGLGGGASAARALVLVVLLRLLVL